MGLSADRARTRRFLEVEAQRSHEQADALDFLVYGDDDGRHTERCLFQDEPCSRTYDPLPFPDAAPTPAAWYVGTGIGALYGLGGEQHLWQLAGWNVAIPEASS